MCRSWCYVVDENHLWYFCFHISTACFSVSSFSQSFSVGDPPPPKKNTNQTIEYTAFKVSQVQGSTFGFIECFRSGTIKCGRPTGILAMVPIRFFVSENLLTANIAINNTIYQYVPMMVIHQYFFMMTLKCFQISKYFMVTMVPVHPLCISVSAL